ncbi:MAG: HAD hydrolase family protein [Chitinophagales bacterium]|nr:HAD hydrolase family protein [Chitinophagales bacterium]
MGKDFLKRLENIQLIALDIDGVMTNGDLLITEDGELLRTMDTKDGFALRMAIQKGMKIIFITGGNSQGVIKRLSILGKTEVFYPYDDKLPVLKRYCEEHQILQENTFYMGDDIPDVMPMKWAGASACPSDATKEAKETAQYICEKPGGKGCVREVLELILRQQNKWPVIE